MRELTTDILIIGAGGAGFRSALSSHEASPDLDIMLISRGNPGMDGITANACSDRMAFHVTLPCTEPPGEENWKEHARDIYEKGGFVSNPDLACLLAKEGRDAFMRLVDLGVPFARDESGNPSQFVTDGSDYARACYTGPYTARDIQHALLDAVQKTGIKILGDCALLEFSVGQQNGCINGALCIDESSLELIFIRCAAVIVASGGPGGIFEDSVFPLTQDATAWYAALKAGAKLVNIEFIQFGLVSCATNLACSGSMFRALPMICSNGDDLLDKVKNIVPGSDPVEILFRKGASWPVSASSNAKPVDIAVFMARREGKRVSLDYRSNPPLLSSYDPGNISKKSVTGFYQGIEFIPSGDIVRLTPYERLLRINPKAVEWFRERGIDLQTESIEIKHAAQHFQGGILINTSAETGVPGLYACGEASGGQHGADRPGGNSLLDCQVMGHVAGIEAAGWARDKSKASASVYTGTIPQLSKQGKTCDSILQAVRENLSRNVSVMRTFDDLKKSLETFHDLRNVNHTDLTGSLVDYYRTISAIHIGYAITLAAYSRDESRGSHMLFGDVSQPGSLIPTDSKRNNRWNVIKMSKGEILLETTACLEEKREK
jgi:succinate dehydrogenase/fumarate reductase flavoprotein subunit